MKKVEFTRVPIKQSHTGFCIDLNEYSKPMFMPDALYSDILNKNMLPKGYSKSLLERAHSHISCGMSIGKPTHKYIYCNGNIYSIYSDRKIIRQPYDLKIAGSDFLGIHEHVYDLEPLINKNAIINFMIAYDDKLYFLVNGNYLLCYDTSLDNDITNMKNFKRIFFPDLSYENADGIDGIFNEYFDGYIHNDIMYLISNETNVIIKYNLNALIDYPSSYSFLKYDDAAYFYKLKIFHSSYRNIEHQYFTYILHYVTPEGITKTITHTKNNTEYSEPEIICEMMEATELASKN